MSFLPYKLEPGTRYRPSNGTEGQLFQCQFCEKCARDKVANGTVAMDDSVDADLCAILNASYARSVDEWVVDGDGNPSCTGFCALAEPEVLS
jgi:hypothetical protein